MSNTDDIGDLFALIRQVQAEEEEKLTPWQRNLKPGDYVVTVYTWLIVYSKIESQERGPAYSWVRAYSVMVPEGESGTTLTSQFTGPLTAAQFAKAKEMGWPPIVEQFKQIVVGDPIWRGAFV
jgi:hypothetical protein